MGKKKCFFDWSSSFFFSAAAVYFVFNTVPGIHKHTADDRKLSSIGGEDYPPSALARPTKKWTLIIQLSQDIDKSFMNWFTNLLSVPFVRKCITTWGWFITGELVHRFARAHTLHVLFHVWRKRFGRHGVGQNTLLGGRWVILQLEDLFSFGFFYWWYCYYYTYRSDLVFVSPFWWRLGVAPAIDGRERGPIVLHFFDGLHSDRSLCCLFCLPIFVLSQPIADIVCGNKEECVGSSYDNWVFFSGSQLGVFGTYKPSRSVLFKDRSPHHHNAGYVLRSLDGVRLRVQGPVPCPVKCGRWHHRSFKRRIRSSNGVPGPSDFT